MSLVENLRKWNEKKKAEKQNQTEESPEVKEEEEKALFKHYYEKYKSSAA